jgi:hypothetical protein
MRRSAPALRPGRQGLERVDYPAERRMRKVMPTASAVTSTYTPMSPRFRNAHDGTPRPTLPQPSRRPASALADARASLAVRARFVRSDPIDRGLGSEGRRTRTVRAAFQRRGGFGRSGRRWRCRCRRHSAIHGPRSYVPRARGCGCPAPRPRAEALRASTGVVRPASRTASHRDALGRC